MKKRIWISSITQSRDAAKDLMTRLKRYGLDVDGHFWEDDLAKMA